MIRLWWRLASSLGAWPDRAGWRDCAGLALPVMVVLPLLGLAGGFVHWKPRLENWPLHILSVMMVPAFSEELLFRGLMIPARGETRRPVEWLTMGVLAFTGWHVVEALTFLPNARLFLTPLFLTAAFGLGLACTLMRYRTGSLWPGVLLHGLIVFIWQAGFGGPSIADLSR